MGDLREIVSVEAMGRLFALLAFVLPLMGVTGGIVWGTLRKDVRRSALGGLAVGMAGPLNWLMWLVYNTLTDHNGLDTVRNVFVNLLVFVAVGLSIGFGVGTAMRHAMRMPSEENAETPTLPQTPEQ